MSGKGFKHRAPSADIDPTRKPQTVQVADASGEHSYTPDAYRKTQAFKDNTARDKIGSTHPDLIFGMPGNRTQYADEVAYRRKYDVANKPKSYATSSDALKTIVSAIALAAGGAAASGAMSGGGGAAGGGTMGGSAGGVGGGTMGGAAAGGGAGAGGGAVGATSAAEMAALPEIVVTGTPVAGGISGGTMGAAAGGAGAASQAGQPQQTQQEKWQDRAQQMQQGGDEQEQQKQSPYVGRAAALEQARVQKETAEAQKRAQMAAALRANGMYSPAAA